MMLLQIMLFICSLADLYVRSFLACSDHYCLASMLFDSHSFVLWHVYHPGLDHVLHVHISFPCFTLFLFLLRFLS